ncbi:phosphoribosyl-AMP cyclohydrolase (PRA-CH) / phosphoribosyl-ATP pyrophosphatase (PRA-PH) [Legionella beliardensis]|uniref:Histidine biosynthesis bifunctional protein HisIE n=1 Tax=Legionella beliardensis TaxID=91822 RepID=A0A378I3P7_9GAMM|nr:bifunctional phosphoribosyl-AMP cyclohydrolase/phosphoribosyl-ATP diphosphatase HisIE [Legionella beliardensis]STX29316.1 phosphoribosyl-AMP cyclohydrolase (PRA-CH) / phosphoribosyl-ATP pyrophosphatase (PRA-PH) [Legionella beliardensis]
MINFASTTLDWEKMSGLIPAVIQHAQSGDVLMLGYMNQDALALTQTSGQLTLFSRSRQELWHKGSTSGNAMSVQAISTDCDGDSLLIQVLPAGPACHLGFKTCFQPVSYTKIGFLSYLLDVITNRASNPSQASYTTQLLQAGRARCAQKVGEEATEVVIAAVKQDENELINESADLLYHLLVLLTVCNVDFYSVVDCLQQRHKI